MISFPFQVSLIYSLPRTATIRAATHCDLLVFEKEDVFKLLRDYPDGELLIDVFK